MKKILMFQDYFDNGGIEKIILDIKNNLSNKYQFDILSIVNKSNNHIVSLINKDYRSFLKRTLYGLKKYKKYLKSNKYDIIHIHCYNSFGLIYAHIAKKYCKNIIVHAHNSEIDKDFLYIKHIINNIIKLFYQNKKYKYIAVSDNANKFCFNNKNTIIINNGIDYSKFIFNDKMRKNYRDLFGINTKDIVIGHIGRFEKQKNHEFIVNIFNEICKTKNNYKLILIGEGKLKNKIKKLIQEMDLESKIILLDRRNDIPNLINMFDIYLFPSLYEGFGITIVENEVNGKYTFISDKVIQDVVISNRVETISLNKDAYYWANEIINHKDKKMILSNRLNIESFIKKIDNIYRGFNEKIS